MRHSLFFPALCLWARLNSQLAQPRTILKTIHFLLLRGAKQRNSQWVVWRWRAVAWELSCIATLLHLCHSLGAVRAGSQLCLRGQEDFLSLTWMAHAGQGKIEAPLTWGDSRSRHRAKHILWTFLFLDHTDLQSLFIKLSCLPLCLNTCCTKEW